LILQIGDGKGATLVLATILPEACYKLTHVDVRKDALGIVSA